MLFSEKLKHFSAAHPCQMMTVDGAVFRYVLSGQADGRTLVLLNGGMNTLEMWIDYVDAFSTGCRVLLFDYPQQLRTNQELVTGMHAFFQKLGIEKPIFIGASDGGMVSQIYVQKYPGEAGGLVLISTGGMDAETLKSLKKKYFLAPAMLWYMKHCNYGPACATSATRARRRLPMRGICSRRFSATTSRKRMCTFPVCLQT